MAGRRHFAQGTAQIGGYDALAALLNMGIKAVHDADPNGADPARRAKTVIHLANGGDNGLYHTVFDALTKRGVDFDVIGLSYYSYWHGPMAELVANMNDISQRYHKPVAVVETAYAYTLSGSDSKANLFDDSSEKEGGYLATVQGDEWENQAMFDPLGRALQAMYVFRLARPDSGSAAVQATITSVAPIAMKVPIKTVPQLPTTVTATYSDDSVRDTAVTWTMPAASAFATDALVTVTGTVAGTTMSATAKLTVTSQINYVDNPGFESGALSPWKVAGDTAAVNASNEVGNPHSGTFALHYWLDKPFAATVTQTITGLDAGTYALSAWFQGVGGEKPLQLFVTCDGKTSTVDVTNTGWQKWTQPTIDKIQVAGGTCTIGVQVNADAGIWGFVDDFELVKSK